MAQEMTIAQRIEEANDEFGVEFEITGGGKGWKGQFVDETGVVHSAAADSKGMVLSLLINEATDLGLDAEADEADEDEEGCSEECRNANPNSVCTCRCGGANHPREEGTEVAVFGVKACACGCGQETKRRYVPGHDARHHFALRAAALGVTTDALRASLRRSATSGRPQPARPSGKPPRRRPRPSRPRRRPLRPASSNQPTNAPGPDRAGGVCYVCGVRPRGNRTSYRYTCKNESNRAKVRAIVDAARDRPCADCGLYEPAIMDFDHVPERGPKLSRCRIR